MVVDETISGVEGEGEDGEDDDGGGEEFGVDEWCEKVKNKNDAGEVSGHDEAGWGFDERGAEEVDDDEGDEN